MRWPWRARTDPHTLAGAYALEALEPADRRRFERHLAACPACRQESRGLREAATLLAGPSVTPPPAGMRDRVLAAASRTRPGSPVLRAVPAGPRRRWGLAAAGAALAIALASGGLAYHSQRELSQEQSQARAVAAVLGAPDAVMMTAHATPRGMATLVMSHRERALVFTAARLPALPPAQAYELWLMGGGRARPAGMLPPPRGGVTAPVLVPRLRSGDTVALTVEPAAGASHPSRSMIMHVALPS